MTESITAKADRYLTEGRVSVRMADHSTPVARVQVSGTGDKPYQVTFLPRSGWECSCPAQRKCAHIIACEKITGYQPIEVAQLVDQDDELTQFLNG